MFGKIPQKFVFSLIVTGILLSSFSAAYALRIVPQRVVMTTDKNIEYVYVKNNAKETKTYRFGWLHLAMTPEGEVVNLDKVGKDKAPNYKAADDIVRYSPRRTVLKPGETQRVTLMAMRSPSLENGEYRSHFLVEQMPNAPAAEKVTANAEQKTTVNVDLLVSRSFPVYIHNGEVSAHLSLAEASLQKNTEQKKNEDPDYFVNFKARKEGNRSILAVAYAFCGPESSSVKIAKAPKLFAIYAEANSVTDKVGINLPAGGCPSVHLVIKGHHDDLLSGQVLAEADLPL